MASTSRSRLTSSLRNIRDWASSDASLERCRITDYIQGNDSIAIAADEVFRLGMNSIGDSLLQAAENPYAKAPQTLATGVLRLLVGNSVIVENLKGTSRTGLDDLDGITHVMLCALATGQFTVVVPCHDAVFSGINNGYGVRDGHNPPIGTTLRYAAFGLSIIGDWLDKPLDLDKHALPRDPAWGQLVANWREPDPDKLMPMLVTACDTHVERIALTSRELDSGSFEFGSPFEAVYPAEILAILNLRRSMGLPNPSIDHPLMKTPYAQLTCPPGMRFEPDELLMRFLAAACKYDPDAVPAGLYEAVVQNSAED